jgi:DNA repair exonuclease SbcCD ATPase subunit
MKIEAIEVSGFASLETAALDFPDAGVLTITGENGAGKSSIFEAVAFALWGDTLRGTPPWMPDRALIAQVAIGGSGTVQRTRAKGGKVRLTPPSIEAFESVSKAQEFVIANFGTFDAWRRSHVFSSQDAAHFSTATDTERKTLIEEICGLTQMDEAHERAKKALRTVDGNLTTAKQDLRVSMVRAEEAKKRLATAKAHLQRTKERKPKIPDSAEDPETLSAEHERMKAKRAPLHDALSVLGTELSDVQATQRTLNARRKVLEAGGECPSCGQNLHETERAAQVKSLRGSLDEAAEEAVVLTGKIADAREALQAHDRLISTLAERVFDARAKAAVRTQGLVAWESDMAHANAEVDNAQDGTDEHATETLRLTHLADKLCGEVALASTVAQVLSPKGLRAVLLTEAISGIEALADSYLQRLSHGMRLTMSSVSVAKNGSVKDAITIDVTGAGGGHGYRGASAGERRRIDVAILLALSEVAAGAHGGVRGTLFFDEVFDSLDPDGIDRVEEILQELAQDRCVVVITHSAEVQKRIRATKRVRVARGTVEET